MKRFIEGEDRSQRTLFPVRLEDCVNGGAKRDHLGGVRRDHLAAAGLSPSPWEGRVRRGVPSTGRRGGARGRDLWAHGVKRGLGGRFSSPSGFDACGSG